MTSHPDHMSGARVDRGKLAMSGALDDDLSAGQPTGGAGISRYSPRPPSRGRRVFARGDSAPPHRGRTQSRPIQSQSGWPGVDAPRLEESGLTDEELVAEREEVAALGLQRGASLVVSGEPSVEGGRPHRDEERLGSRRRFAGTSSRRLQAVQLGYPSSAAITASACLSRIDARRPTIASGSSGAKSGRTAIVRRPERREGRHRRGGP